MSFISSFNIISDNIISAQDRKSFLYIPVSDADTAAVNLNEIKTLLANGLVMV